MKTIRSIIAVSVLIAAGSIASFAQTEQLPISVFVDAIPVSGGAVYWTTADVSRTLYIDMFGRRNAWFHLSYAPTISGNVTVRNLGDGTERVTIVMRTTNAICWGFARNINGANQPAFGYSPLALASGGNASLGDVWYRAEFTQPEGYPIPRISDITVSPRVPEFLATEIMCQNGELRAGSGYPEGTRGFAQTTQIGLFDTGVPTGCPPELEGNCFPAERISFMPTGAY